MIAKTVDQYLDEVDYGGQDGYVPSDFALGFVNFVKLVFADNPLENATPVLHYRMIDRIVGKRQRICNLAHRGAAKTSLFVDFLILYCAVFNNIPDFGSVDGIIFVGANKERSCARLRDSIQSIWDRSSFLQHWLPTCECTIDRLRFVNRDGVKVGVEMFGAQSSIRGVLIDNQRPKLALLDDLINSDEDAASKSIMESVKNTVHKSVVYALHPTRRKIILNATPFNKNDVAYEAVESGAWEVNVWPIAEKFPCSREEFRGSWPERFDYDSVMESYTAAQQQGKLAGFLQEMMLRITSEEERLVQDDEIAWYSIVDVLANPQNYYFYLTTDLAFNVEQHNDYSVKSVWAYDKDENWLWVGGTMGRVTSDKSLEDIFQLQGRFSIQEVGIEVSGQQKGFADLVRKEQLLRNQHFMVRDCPTPGSKLGRFNMMVPKIKAGKVKFPLERKNHPVLVELLHELSLTTFSGIRSKHDDVLDTVTQLQFLKPIAPTEGVVTVTEAPKDHHWHRRPAPDKLTPLSRYLA